MQVDPNIPLCQTCGHYHEQGCRCAICGHVGKSQLFAKMRMKANEKRSIRIEQVSISKDNLSSLHAFELVRELRLTSVASNATIDDVHDYQSTHLLAHGKLIDCFFNYFLESYSAVGDALAGTVRYRWIQVENNLPKSTLIDKLCINPLYYRRKVTWTLLAQLFRTYLQNNVTIQELYIIVPRGTWIEEACCNQGFQKIDNVDPSLISFDSNIMCMLHMKAMIPHLMQYIDGKLS